jgi:hypothetical protein
MQTKYTGLLAPAVMLAYAAVFAKYRLGVVAAATAALLFAAWEFVIVRLYGESHFLYHLQSASAIQSTKYVLAIPLLCILGALASPTMLLGLAGLRLRKRWLAMSAGFILLAYALVAGVPEKYATFKNRTGPYTEPITLADFLFGSLGIIVLGTAAAVLWRMCRLSQEVRWRFALRRYRVEWFLLLWFIVEIMGYFALSPFPAARRVMGIVVVMTFLTGRLAARTCRSPARRRLVYYAAFGSIMLGLGFYGVDLRDALAEKQAAQQAADLLQPQAGSTVWYVGHWGFQFYAEHAGMRPVVPGRSRLRKGDWLVMPDERITQQMIALHDDATALRFLCRIEDSLPLRTVSCYYGGRTPLQHQEGTRVLVRIYRVTADYAPPAKAVSEP